MDKLKHKFKPAGPMLETAKFSIDVSTKTKAV